MVRSLAQVAATSQLLVFCCSCSCQLFLSADPASCSCQLFLPAVPASLLLMVLQLLSLLQLSGHCSCSCLATAAAHSLLLVLQLFLPAAAAADGVAAALQLSGNCQLLLTGLTA